MRASISSARILWCFGLVSVASWHSTSAAHADAQQAAPELPLADVVTVVPGATCLEAERLTLRIARWREQDTVDARIRVQVKGDDHTANKVTFAVTKEGGYRAERTLTDAPTDCDQLHSAVALAIGLAIDATLTDSRAQSEAALPVPTPQPSAAPAPPPPPPAMLPEREAPPSAATAASHLDVAILAGPAVSVFEDTSLMLAPRVTYLPWPWFGVAVASFVTYATQQPVGDARGYFDATIAALGVDACFGGEPDPSLSLHLCAGARVGAMLVEGAGFQENFSTGDLWTVAIGSGQVRAWLTDTIGVGAGVTIQRPLAAHVVRVAGTGGTADQLTELPRLGIAVELGPVFRLF